MAFDPIKHKIHIDRGASLKAMVNDRGQEIPGATGASGVVEDIEGGKIGIDKIQLLPDSSFVPHTHPGHHILYVLRGRGFMTIGDQEYSMNRGDTLYVEANQPHAMRSTKTHRLIVLAIGFPHKAIDAADRMTVVEGV